MWPDYFKGRDCYITKQSLITLKRKRMDTSKTNAQGTPGTTQTTGEAGSAARNKEIARKVYEVFGNGNYNELDNIISNDVVEHTPDPFIKGTGLKYVKDLFKAYKEAIPDLNFTINDLIAEGDMIVARITLTGTNKGSIMGKPATNKKIKIDGIDICRIRNGKITDHWGVWDNLALVNQLGFVPEKF